MGQDVNDEIFGCPQFEKSLSFGDYVDQNFRAVCAVFSIGVALHGCLCD